MSSATPLAPTGVASRWIVKPGFDLPLVLLTPLLALPLLWLWRERRGDEAVYAAVMSFGALGHHLPGMLRAYGDRALFRRYRARFLLAPLFLVLVCAGFQIAGLHGLAVVALGWGIWHGWMQTFGFARIYDAKRGSFARTTARIDFALCAAWFAGAVAISPQRTAQVLEALARAGVPLPPAAAVDAVRALAWLSIALTSTAYVVWSLREARAARAPSAQKHVLLASTFALWWVATQHVPSLLFGLALFEVFHDVQYLAIVWAFNRRRAENASSGALTRFLFRGGALGAGLYVGLVFAYGALGPLAEQAGEERVREALIGALLASQLLHFYFDGFLWKVREAPTRASLGVAGGGIASTEESAAKAAVATALPEDAEAQTQAGLALAKIGRAREALVPLRRALELDPSAPERKQDLARTLGEAADGELSDGRPAAARALLAEAATLEPRFPELLELLASSRAAAGELDAALRTLAALDLLRPDARWRLAAASLLAESGRLEEALAEVRRVRAEAPAHPGAFELERQILARRSGRIPVPRR